ncbi:putative LRR receptor-like serine/threonine-protein kinase [Prunus yedoensis var. nudiflora]|uniref:Putative LRR receptor-like serine/threonine-protein kinase n=1 Tax=Prunus yedoensis var. nudiflora TaxID=2094558 RepID=A0A314YGC2_PRUYE|nr:putative LRR receptor-like serine/threonine-protein kinase [Prunus yedoensis var. nudiflora]
MSGAAHDFRDLSNNNLTGPIPDFLSELPNLTHPKKKHSFVIPIVVSIAGIFILLLVVAAICWWGFKRKRQHGDVIDAKAIPQYGSLESTSDSSHIMRY